MIALTCDACGEAIDGRELDERAYLTLGLIEGNWIEARLFEIHAACRATAAERMRSAFEGYRWLDDLPVTDEPVEGEARRRPARRDGRRPTRANGRADVRPPQRRAWLDPAQYPPDEYPQLYKLHWQDIPHRDRHHLLLKAIGCNKLIIAEVAERLGELMPDHHITTGDIRPVITRLYNKGSLARKGETYGRGPKIRYRYWAKSGASERSVA